MKFKFIGAPGESHESINQFGIEFPLNKAIEVTDEKQIRKLSGHPHFAAVGKPKTDESGDGVAV